MLRDTHTRQSSESGVTVVEFMVASLVLFIAAISAVSALTFAATASASTSTRARALNLANQRIEQARNLPYDSVGVFYPGGAMGDPAGSIPASETVGDLQVATKVTWKRDTSTGRSTYKDIKVTVSWITAGGGQVSLASSVFGTSALSMSGDLKIMVLEDGAGTRVPIAMAQVWVTPNGSPTQRVAWTDLQGEAFLGALPVGVAPVRVVADGWLFDDSLLATVTVVPDIVTTVYAYGYRPCSLAVTVVDTSGTPIPGAAIQTRDQKGRVASAVTGSGGVATFSQILPSTYNVSAAASGRTTGYASVGPMVGGNHYTLTITLTQYVPSGSMRVRVTGGGAALASAVVKVTGPAPGSTDVTGSPKTTPTSGEAAFSSLTTGRYTVAVSRTGYTPATVTADIVGGVEAIVNVDLIVATTGTGTLRIFLVDEHGRVWDDHEIYVWGPNGYYYAGKTDHFGTRTLSNLAAGTYTVQVQSGETKSVQVTNGTTSDVQVAMY
jgi:hypothetical protein